MVKSNLWRQNGLRAIGGITTEAEGDKPCYPIIIIYFIYEKIPYILILILRKI